MPDLTNPLFPRIAQHLSQVADDRQLGILIADSRGNPAEQSQAIEQLLERGVDDILIVPQKGTAPGLQRVPTVIIKTTSDPDNTVSANHAGGGTLIAEHIAGLGHRHVVLQGEDRVSEVQRDRINGLRLGLQSTDAVQEFWGADGMAQLASAIKNGATAILTTSDLLALRVHSHLTQCGVVVPDDVSLTGFDDLPFAIDRLLRAIQGDGPPPPNVTIPMRLVILNSTAPKNQTTNIETIK